MEACFEYQKSARSPRLRSAAVGASRIRSLVGQPTSDHGVFALRILESPSHDTKPGEPPSSPPATAPDASALQGLPCCLVVAGLREPLLMFSWQAFLRMLLKLGEWLSRAQGRIFKLLARAWIPRSEVNVNLIEMNSPSPRNIPWDYYMCTRDLSVFQPPVVWPGKILFNCGS